MSFNVAHAWERPPDPDAAEEWPPGQSGLFSNLKLGWWTRGPHLEVRQLTAARTKVGGWRFGGGPARTITAVAELSRTGGGLPLLLVALHCPIGGGTICVLDCFLSKVVRAVHVDHRITKIHVINPGCNGSTLPEISPLKYLDGCVALGTAGGDVLLMDLNKQACENSIDDLDASVRDESNPSTITVLRKDKMADIKKKIEKSVARDEHIAVYLNVPDRHETAHFALKSETGDDIVHVDRAELEVSALFHVPQFGCLLVGYNFGAFQLWDLRNFNLIYTSPICEDNVPIVDFLVQEPADDPKAYCYVWVAYSNALSDWHRKLPCAVLYSFYFDRKIQKNPNLYEDFRHCSVRFQMDLGDPVGAIKSARGGAFLTFQSVSGGGGGGLSLCHMSWSYWRTPPEVYTGVLVFDLNQWYKEQMPAVPNWNRCSNYIVKNGVEMALSDIKMDPKSLVQFMGVQRPEEHFCPTALSFDLWGVSHETVVKIRNKGAQKHFLDTIASSQHLALLRPENSYEKIAELGLVPLFWDVRNSASLDQDSERELLFCVALEHNLTGWMARACAKMADGAFDAADLRMGDVTRWALRRAVAVKAALQQFCGSLFDASGAATPDSRTLDLIGGGLNQIRNVCTLYRYVSTELSGLVADLEEFEADLQSLDNLVVYFETLLWMTNVGLLPERHDGAGAPYPVAELTNYYRNRRATLRQSMRGTFAENDRLLFIDSLIDHMEGGEALRQQWVEDEGDRDYPPPSLQSVLRTYLVTGPRLRDKHRLVAYALLDVAFMARDVAKLLLKFPQIVALAPSDIKTLQAFWYLDHERDSDCLECVTDACVRADDLRHWQHRLLMTSLMARDRSALALLYWRVRKPPLRDDADLCVALSLLIARDLTDAAFELRGRGGARDDRAVLAHIFRESEARGALREVARRRLDARDEAAFLRYLSGRAEPRRDDLRAFYYLVRARFLEAFEVRADADATGFTDSVVRLFERLLPNVNRDLVELVRRERPNLWREHARPEPFSVFVHDRLAHVQYKSSVHLAALRKATDTYRVGATASRRPVVMATTETTPFLRTPTAFRRRPDRFTPVLTTKVIEPNELEEEEEGPTPRKRVKLSPRKRVDADKSASTNQNRSLSSANQSALTTPLVKRARASLRGRVTSPPPPPPPASILKLTAAQHHHHHHPDGDDTFGTPLKLSRVKFDDVSSPSESLSGATEAATPPVAADQSGGTSRDVSDDVFHSPERSDHAPLAQDDDDVSKRFDSPRARRSYKRSYGETFSPIRAEVTFSESDTSASDVQHFSDSTLSADASKLEEEGRVRARVSTGVKARASLTRVVLERNAYATLSAPAQVEDEPEEAGADVYDDVSSASEDVHAVMEQLRDETSQESGLNHARFLDSVHDDASSAAETHDAIEIRSSSDSDDDVSSQTPSSRSASTPPELERNVIEERSEDGVRVETRSVSVQCTPSLRLRPKPDDVDRNVALSPDAFKLRTVKKTYGRRTRPDDADAEDRNVASSPDVLKLRTVKKTYGRKPPSTQVEEEEEEEEEEGKTPTRRRSRSQSVEATVERRRTRRVREDNALSETLLDAMASPEMAQAPANKTGEKSTARTTRRKTRAATEEPIDVVVVATPSKRRRSYSVEHQSDAVPLKGRYSRSKSVDVDFEETSVKPAKTGSKKSSLSEWGEYAGARRLTRRQASMLNAIDPDRKLPVLAEVDLLDKPEVKGNADREEASPSTSSEASSMRRTRATRSTTPTVSGIKSRLRRASADTASVTSERSEATPSPPKNRKTRSRTASVSSQKSLRGRKASGDLPPLEETAEEGNAPAPARKRGRN